ncbi:MAG TPA: SGNH/GDSL hydrolase family protein, partial [Ideonella sp.]|nr:SGNH/GDSL hydrolase family protein [Ideonella sp.]
MQPFSFSALVRALPLACALAAASLASAAVSAAGTPPKVQAAPLRIMLIGDSITEGDAGGYRYPLFQKISAASGMPNFVGRRNGRLSDPPEFVDDDHEGYSAYRIDEITSGIGFWSAPPIETRLHDWDPAIVTIHAGTNDAQQHYHFGGDATLGIPSAIDRLDDMVSRIIAYNPAIYIIVSQIIPANPPASETTQAYILGLNSQIPGLVERHRALGHRVYLVDQYTPMLDHPNPDGIHPDAAGYAVMAEVWFQAMMAALPSKPVNPDPGRFWGLHQVDRFSTVTSTPWTLQPNLIRAGSQTLAGVETTGYQGSHPPALLNDGSQAAYSNDRDYASTTTFTLNTTAAPQGYDITA